MNTLLFNDIHFATTTTYVKVTIKTIDSTYFTDF